MAHQCEKLFLLVAVVCLTTTVFGKPRDGTIFQNQNVLPASEFTSPKEVTISESPVDSARNLNFPGRVACEYEEATEDTVCQEHCLPKGYTYGLCVSRTCSCI